MIKKLMLATLLLLTFVPTLVGAANMQVTSSALPATGGSITPNGLKFFSGPATYTIAVKPGWTIGSVLIDNVASPNGTATLQTVPFDPTKAHTVKVTFVQALYSITTSAGAGGSIQITGGGSTGILPGSTRTAVVAPGTGYKITDITVDSVAQALPADPTVALSIPFANIQANHTVSAAFAFIPRVSAYAGPDQAVTTSGSAPWIATLTGSASSNAGAITYQWNLVGYPVGAVAGFGSPANSTTPFTMNKTGAYSVTLTATSGGVSVTSAPSTITVITPAQEASKTCITCHTGSTEVTGWQASIHGTSAIGPSCPACHMSNQEAHPGLIGGGSVDEATFTFTNSGSLFCSNCHGAGSTHKTPGMTCAACHNNGGIHNPDARFSTALTACFTCHGGANTPHFYTKAVLTTAQCGQCHNQAGHNPLAAATVVPEHFNGYTSPANPAYAAAYVTPATECSNCHQGGDPAADADKGIVQFRSEWAASGHGDVTAPAWKNSVENNWKSSSGCQQCHAAKGFIRFVTMSSSTPVDVNAPGYSEPLTCNACHQPDYTRRALNIIGPSYTYTFPVNSGTNVSATYQISSSYWTNSESNICMPCHSGTVNGELIKQASAFADFTAAGRLRPHGMVAGGMIGKAIAVGYNFDEATYQGKHNTYHSFIGVANYWGDGYRGPCVTCHMRSSRHTFAAVSRNADGTVAGLTAQAICDKCHGLSYVAGGPMTPVILNARKAGFAAALQALKAQLQKSGFDPDAPVAKNWGTSAHVRANNMGAYYNYFLLRDGDRAAYVHGPEYSRRLIVASLNWLDDAAFNDSAYAAINNLAAEGRISGATRDSAISYLNITANPFVVTGVCATCHAGVDSY